MSVETGPFLQGTMRGGAILRAWLSAIVLVLLSAGWIMPAWAVTHPGFAGHGQSQFYSVKCAVLAAGDTLLGIFSPSLVPIRAAPALKTEQST